MAARGVVLGALRGGEKRIDGGIGAGAVRLDGVEGAGGDQAFQHALVDGARIDAAAEIGEIGERPLAARGDDALDRLAADAAQRGERVMDGVAVDVELDAGAIDRRRLDLDPEPLGLGAEFGELVGIAHVERHRRRQELDRVIRLHIGGLIGQQRIRRRVRFVEAVFGEFGAGVEDHLGVGAADAALDRAGDEAVALRRHLLAVLLAHGAAQDVGLAEAVAGEIARDLLHLLLIGDDAVGRLQDRLQLGMQIIGALVAELARAIGRDIRHRARPVERHQHDQILETVGAHVDQRPAHALTFNLEHADGFAARQHFVGLGVVERQVGEIEVDAAPAHQLDRVIEHGERL